MGYIITDTRAEYFNRDTNCNELVASVVCDDVSDLPVNTATQKFIVSIYSAGSESFYCRIREEGL